MKKLPLFSILLGFMLVCSGCFGMNDSKEAEEIVDQYYSHLSEGNYEKSTVLLSEEYIDFLGATPQDIIEVFRQMETEQGFTVHSYSILSVDKVESTNDVPIQLQSQMTGEKEYIIRVESKVEVNGTENRIPDDVLVSMVDGEWKIKGIVSYSPTE
ncbi:hypothetical protein JOC86_000007 [Bacillus pakistanensis]|uniref:DUF4878 domain-containing protein n=1 Tax=Rossellomorea pakistanensis TaxID=992288 RepID=A0ABS2N6N7_9BACI|nr:hypothetical protein [Bacillus pakistanensis]MBM7583470.1 hypothetical protein [Bacillus pakistanensis]